MADKEPREMSVTKARVLYTISLVALIAQLLVSFGVFYTASASAKPVGADIMKIVYLGMVAGFIIILGQALLIYRLVLSRLEDKVQDSATLGRQLEQLSVLDNQTKAFNRKKYDAVVTRELENVSRYGHGLTGIMFDIDHFKNINDTHGYRAGDKVLYRLARFVSGRIRKTDYLFRWRGGKFIILAPHIDLDKAAIVGEKLRKAAAKKAFGDGINLTISLGVAEAGEGDDPDTFMQHMQAGLTAAKSKGRNRTAVFRL